MAVLIDTGFLLATVSSRDAHHAEARDTLRGLEGNWHIAAPVLPELFYMTMVRVSYDSAVNIVHRITTSGITIVNLDQVDHMRMDEIMRQYRDAQFDFVDVAIMAVAERLAIRHIYTFDRRDFALFRPRHCDYLELLP